MLLLEEKTWSCIPPSKWAHFPIMKIDLICFVISTDLDLISIQVKYSTSCTFESRKKKNVEDITGVGQTMIPLIIVNQIT